MGTRVPMQVLGYDLPGGVKYILDGEELLGVGSVPLSALDDYVQGSIIIGGAADWEALAHPGTAYHLQTDATDVVWAQNVTMANAAWIGNSAATARLGFDSSGATDFAYFMGCNVGIGTTGPETLTHLSKSASGVVGAALYIDNPAGADLGNEVQIAFGANAGASFAGVTEARIRVITRNAVTAAASFQIDTWNGVAEGTRFYIKEDGNVGIGTTGPGARFQVNTIAATIGVIIKGAAAQTANLTEWQDSAGNIFISTGDGLTGSIFSGNVQLADIDFVWAGATEANLFRVDAATNEVRCGDWDTNYSAFEVDGTLKFIGNATVWDDLITPFDSARVPAANAPTWAAFVGNLNAYRFSVNDLLEVTTEVLHGYKEDSDIELHVHWATNGSDVNIRAVNWEIEYTLANSDIATGIGDAFPATVTITTETAIPAATPDRTHMYTSVGTIAGAGIDIGAIIKARIRRIAAVGTAPTSDSFGLNLGIHYELDTVGSRTLGVK